MSSLQRSPASLAVARWSGWFEVTDTKKSPLYPSLAGVALAVQVAVVAAAVAAGAARVRPLLIARYYVLTTASLVAGLWDWLAHGTHAGWEPAEGTR